tara:strand:+ start:141 stop:431 length:291 start_codon:yes stop_codon:yes gene_type:complete
MTYEIDPVKIEQIDEAIIALPSTLTRAEVLSVLMAVADSYANSEMGEGTDMTLMLIEAVGISIIHHKADPSEAISLLEAFFEMHGVRRSRAAKQLH